MKTIYTLLFMAGLTFAANTISAQASTSTSAKPTQASNATTIAQGLTSAVKQTVTGVTPDQEKKIMSAETDYANGLLDVRNSNPSAGSQNDKMASYNKVMALGQTRDAQIKSILTDDQYTQYKSTQPGGGAPSTMPQTMPQQTGK